MTWPAPDSLDAATLTVAAGLVECIQGHDIDWNEAAA